MFHLYAASCGNSGTCLNITAALACPARCFLNASDQQVCVVHDVSQCFDTTTPSEAHAGVHEPLHIDGKDLPRWSKALMQYRCDAGTCQLLAAWRAIVYYMMK